MLDLAQELKRFKQLRADLETVPGMDEMCLMDTLEGETNLNEVLLRIDDEIQEREGHVVAITQRIEALELRKARHVKMIETLRTIILRAMDSAGIKKVEGPAATISVVNPKPELQVENDALIPAEFWIPQNPKLDKAKLAAALQLGAIEGARLGNGRINLQIRRR